MISDEFESTKEKEVDKAEVAEREPLPNPVMEVEPGTLFSLEVSPSQSGQELVACADPVSDNDAEAE